MVAVADDFSPSFVGDVDRPLQWIRCGSIHLYDLLIDPQRVDQQLGLLDQLFPILSQYVEKGRH